MIETQQKWTTTTRNIAKNATVLVDVGYQRRHGARMFDLMLILLAPTRCASSYSLCIKIATIYRCSQNIVIQYICTINWFLKSNRGVVKCPLKSTNLTITGEYWQHCWLLFSSKLFWLLGVLWNFTFR